MKLVFSIYHFEKLIFQVEINFLEKSGSQYNAVLEFFVAFDVKILNF